MGRLIKSALAAISLRNINNVIIIPTAYRFFERYDFHCGKCVLDNPLGWNTNELQSKARSGRREGDTLVIIFVFSLTGN